MFSNIQGLPSLGDGQWHLPRSGGVKTKTKISLLLMAVAKVSKFLHHPENNGCFSCIPLATASSTSMRTLGLRLCGILSQKHLLIAISWSPILLLSFASVFASQNHHLNGEDPHLGRWVSLAIAKAPATPTDPSRDGGATATPPSEVAIPFFGFWSLYLFLLEKKN